MSFLRSVFFGKPDQSEQEYVDSLVASIKDGRDVHDSLISLKELFPKFSNSIAEKIIPPLVDLLASEKENDGVLSHVFYYLYYLLSDENEKKIDYANLILKQPKVIHNLVELLFSEERKRINVTIKFIKRLSSLSARELQNTMVTENDDMIRFFSKIEDKDPQFRQDFFDLLPLLIKDSIDMQNIVGFNALNQLVDLIAPGRDSIIDILQSVLNNNKITQKLFTDSGYLPKIQPLIRINNHKAFQLLNTIFSNGGSKEFQDQISRSGIIELLIENIISGNERTSNLDLLLLIIQDAPQNCSVVSKHIGKIVNLYNSDYSIRASFLPLFETYFSNTTEDDIANVFSKDTISNSPVQIYDLGTVAILSNHNLLSAFGDLINSSVEHIDKAIPPSLRFAISACDGNSQNCDFYTSQTNSFFIHLYCILMDGSTRPDVSYLISLFFKVLLRYQNNSSGNYLNKIYPTLIGDEYVNTKLSEGKSEAFDKWNVYCEKLTAKMIDWNFAATNKANENLVNDNQTRFIEDKIQLTKQIEELNNQVSHLKSRENELEKENMNLKAGIEEKENEVVSVNKVLEETNSKIKQFQQEILNLEGKLQGSQKTINYLEESVEDANKTICSLKSENESLLYSSKDLDNQEKEKLNNNNQKIAQYQNELLENSKVIQNLSNEIEKMKSELEFSNENNKKFSQNNAELQNEISNLQTTVEKLNNNILLANEEIKNKDILLKQVENERSQLILQKDALELEISENNSKLDLYQSQKDALNSIIADLKLKNDETNNQMDNLRRTISENIDNDDEAADLRNENARMKAEIDHIQGELDKAQKEKSELNQQIKEFKQKDSELNEKIRNLEEISNESQAKISEYENLFFDFEEAKQQIDKLSKEISSLNSEKEIYLNEIENYKGQLKEMNNQNKSMDTSSSSSSDDDKNEECDRLQNIIIKLQNELTELNNKHDEEINTLKSINDKNISKVCELDEQLKSKENIINETEVRLKEQVNSTLMAQKKLDQVIDELREAKQKIKELEEIIQKSNQNAESEKLINFNNQNNISEIAADIVKSDSETLTQAPVEKDCEFESMKNDLILIKSERDSLQRNFEQLETEFKSTKAELESTIRSKDNELVDANEKLRRLQQESTDRDSLIFRIKELEDILAKERGLSNKALTARLSTSEAETSSLRRELEKAAARHSRLVADRDSLSQTNQELRARIDGLKSEHDRDHEKWARKRAALEEEIAGFRGQLDIEVGGLKARLADTERRMADGEVIAVRAPTDEELEHINSMRTTVLRFDQENQRLSQENTELRLRIAHLEDGDLAVKLRAATKKIAKLNKLLTAIPDAELLKAEVAELRAKVKFYKRAAAEAQKESETKARALTEQLEATSSKLQTAQVENTQLMNELCQAKAASVKAEDCFGAPELPSNGSILSISSVNTERKAPPREDDSEHKKALRLIGKMWLADQMRSPK